MVMVKFLNISTAKYRGKFNTSTALSQEYTTGTSADYAYVAGTLSYWYWNPSLAIPGWVNQEISEAAYIMLSPSQRAAVPYVVVP